MKVTGRDGAVIFFLFLVLFAVGYFLANYWAYIITVTLSYIFADRVFAFTLRRARRQIAIMTTPYYALFPRDAPTVRFVSASARFFAVLGAILLSSFFCGLLESGLNKLSLAQSPYLLVFDLVFSILIVIVVYVYFIRKQWD